MPDSLQTLVPYPLSGAQFLLILLAAVAGVAVLLAVFRKPLRRWRQERQIARAVKRMGAKRLVNVWSVGVRARLLERRVICAQNRHVVNNCSAGLACAVPT